MAEVKDKIVTVESLSLLMTKENPTGVGAFSLNRKDNTEVGKYSHAEGYNATASGQASHAEGSQTTASGLYSHAEGVSTDASGAYSHAEGSGVIANGTASHAEGSGTVAKGISQHVQGKFNIEDTSNTYAHIVGNGESVDARSNAHTLDWDGNAWFAGNLSTDGNLSMDGNIILGTNSNIILTANQYGDYLPEAGIVGRIFFKRVIE